MSMAPGSEPDRPKRTILANNVLRAAILEAECEFFRAAREAFLEEQEMGRGLEAEEDGFIHDHEDPDDGAGARTSTEEALAAAPRLEDLVNEAITGLPRGERKRGLRVAARRALGKEIIGRLTAGERESLHRLAERNLLLLIPDEPAPED